MLLAERVFKFKYVALPALPCSHDLSVLPLAPAIRENGAVGWMLWTRLTGSDDLELRYTCMTFCSVYYFCLLSMLHCWFDPPFQSPRRHKPAVQYFRAVGHLRVCWDREMTCVGQSMASLAESHTPPKHTSRSFACHWHSTTCSHINQLGLQVSGFTAIASQCYRTAQPVANLATQ